ncbi:MAG: anti-sigma factor [Ardenticatenaceae bacterium]|nr:anti-sigma factor [Anaerolineales bacterium]MCB8941325.1 anti-sigma factor [Ardenticatenaceae bacterium]MCB8972681.1 anti-sigma factor [Ardenticatenaceae bacterium]
MNEQIEELLAVYVLGGLSPEEEAEVEAYVATHPEAASLLEEAYAAAALLPYTAPPLEPSAESEAALFARVEADLAVNQASVKPTAVSHPKPITKQPTLLEQIRAFFSTPLVTGMSLATAVLLLVWGLSLRSQIQGLDQNVQQLTAENSSLRTDFDALAGENLDLNTRVVELQAANQALDQQLDDLDQENTNLIAANNSLQTDLATAISNLAAAEAYSADLQAQMAEILASQPFVSANVYAVTLPGAEDQPQASAQLVIDPESNTAMLIVNGMPALPEDSVYQVLLIRGTEHETAETFRVDTQGEGVLLVHSTEPLQSFEAVGVSIEPEGGSVQRTGDIVLLGSIIN